MSHSESNPKLTTKGRRVRAGAIGAGLLIVTAGLLHATDKPGDSDGRPAIVRYQVQPGDTPQGIDSMFHPHAPDRRTGGDEIADQTEKGILHIGKVVEIVDPEDGTYIPAEDGLVEPIPQQQGSDR